MVVIAYRTCQVLHVLAHDLLQGCHVLQDDIALRVPLHDSGAAFSRVGLSDPCRVDVEISAIRGNPHTLLVLLLHSFQKRIDRHVQVHAGNIGHGCRMVHNQEEITLGGSVGKLRARIRVIISILQIHLVSHLVVQADTGLLQVLVEFHVSIAAEVDLFLRVVSRKHQSEL